MEGSEPLVIALEGHLDAVAEAALEDAMRLVRRNPIDVIFDVSHVERLEVEVVLLLADHAEWLGRRSCRATLVGASSDDERLARMLGYERALGLT